MSTSPVLILSSVESEVVIDFPTVQLVGIASPSLLKFGRIFFDTVHFINNGGVDER
jgi:hypothetical protein